MKILKYVYYVWYKIAQSLHSINSYSRSAWNTLKEVSYLKILYIQTYTYLLYIFGFASRMPTDYYN